MANLFRLFKRKHKKKNKVPFFAYNARRKHPSYAFKKTKDDKYYNFLLSTGSEKEKYKQLLTPLRKNQILIIMIVLI